MTGDITLGTLTAIAGLFLFSARLIPRLRVDEPNACPALLVAAAEFWQELLDEKAGGAKERVPRIG